MPFDPMAMRPVIETTLVQIHAALPGSPMELLGAERLRIYPDAVKGFRLESALRVRIVDAPGPRADRDIVQ